MNLFVILFAGFVCLATFADGKKQKTSSDYSASTVFSEKVWLNRGCPDFSFVSTSAANERSMYTGNPSSVKKFIELYGNYFSDCTPTRATSTSFYFYDESEEIAELLTINPLENATYRIADTFRAETSTCVVKSFSDYECNEPSSVLVPFSFAFSMVADVGSALKFKYKNTDRFDYVLDKIYNVNRCKNEASATFGFKVGNVTVDTENDVTLGLICNRRRGFKTVYDYL